jgi:hypothetical protein
MKLLQNQYTSNSEAVNNQNLTNHGFSKVGFFKFTPPSPAANPRRQPRQGRRFEQRAVTVEKPCLTNVAS